MADEARRHPPSERKLARLRLAGSTPASPALVAAAVIAMAALLLTLAGPAVASWMAGWVRRALLVAAGSDAALEFARSVAWQGILLTGGIGILMLSTALLAQAAQVGRRLSAAPAEPGRREATPEGGTGAWLGARAVLLIALAVPTVAAAVRGVLLESADTSNAQNPPDVFVMAAQSVGPPLLIMLLAAAVLDAVASRVAWFRAASMTRREVEEEIRETEGHPLTRERRAVTARRRRNA
ncbi:MAG: EscU/YscU/HrcU family type III secretion system export apparatus switch protein [Armatimonadota bacterium]